MQRYLAGIAVCLALFSTRLVSQNSKVENSASVVGTVTDATGAVIPNAALDLTASTRGVKYTATSDVRGQYAIKSLPADKFVLQVVVPGFKTYRRENLQVAVGQTVRVDVRLEVGAASDSITISSETTLLKSDTGALVVNGMPGGTSQYRLDQLPVLQVGAARGGMAPVQMTPGVAYQMADSRFRAETDRYNAELRSRYPQLGTQEYGQYAENEFTTPAADPLSTFGTDVDTASYSNARRFLRDGQMPPPESVRIEELINYFSYDYPLPEKGKPVSMTTHVIKSPWNEQRLLLHVGLRTQPIAAEDLPPSSLTFLIDVSGSMSPPDRLPLIQQALQMLVRQLRPQDRVSLVVYAGASGTVLKPTSGGEQDTILSAIRNLSAGGSTNGAQGIRLAYQTARQAFLKDGNNRVILATDGDFNVGVTSDDELVRLIEEERKSGVFLSVFGVGRDNLKDSKMQKLADHGNGTYAYLDSLSEARKVFVQELGATLVTVAKDVKLQIEFNPARVKEYRLIGYEKRLLRPEDFNDDTKDAGDMGAGHQVTAFYEIIPTESASSSSGVDGLRYQEVRNAPAPNTAARPAEMAWVKMRYKAPQSDTSQLLEWPVAAGALDFRQAPKDVRFAAAVAEYGLLLRHSKFAGNATLNQVLSIASETTGADLAGHRTEFLDLVRRASQLSGR
ncbi:MAG: von Willebrand factor type A domain-containing protein [Acidobacteriota bacterium]